ncbi:hypothetical protein [Thermococcus gorgonarius]|uniref:Zinc ribbon domain-containing protein n=1 Tax=Thermococcus gorgonarius TaxID=71997 RepID=A0A2Z2MFY4_THEGO|nr:hypothetical protein [Thermococcus gorgonarius]ASJ00858.1 hypothetical protein A3K92_04875 [Thermococcus gorgonarius]
MEAGFRCERCGAPLEVSPETIVAICPYCGFPNHISGNLKTESIFIIPSVNKNAIAKAFWDHVEGDFDLNRIKDEIQVVDIEGHYAPYWSGIVHVYGTVRYMRREQECHTDSKGNTHCHTVERHYIERVNENMHLLGSARRQVKSLGVDDLIKHFSKTRPEGKRLLDLDEDEWSKVKLEILNTEMDERHAKLMMREDAVDIVRNHFLAKSDRIELFDIHAEEPRDVKLLLLPMWTVYYKYQNSIFHAVFAGWDGKRVAATEPMNVFRRAQYLTGAGIGILLGAFGSAYTGSGVGALILTAIGGGIGWFFGSKVLEGQRVERGG